MNNYCFYIFQALVGLLLVANINAQECNYPSEYVTFDKDPEVYQDSLIEVKVSSKNKLEDDYGMATVDKIAYTTKVTQTESFVIEFLFKSRPGSDFMVLLGGVPTKGKKQASPIHLSIDAKEIFLKTEYFASGKRQVDKKTIQLNGEDILSSKYYFDQEWHHFVAIYNPKDAFVKLIVDGKTSEEFQLDLKYEGTKDAYGLIGSVNRNSGTNAIIDQVAFYFNKQVKEGVLARHSELLKSSEKNYDFCLQGDFDLDVVTKEESVDLREFPIGYTHYKELADVNEPIVQLRSYPNPRYAEDCSLERNFPWFEYKYLAGLDIDYKGTNNSSLVTKSVELQDELVKNWNYGVQVPLLTKKDKLSMALIDYANQNPDIPSYMTINWHFARPSLFISTLPKKPFIKNSALRNSYYHQAKIKKQTKKFFNAGNNLEVIRLDGYAQKVYLDKTLKELKRPISLINENGEVSALHSKYMYQTPLNEEPEDRKLFFSEEVTRIRSVYKTSLFDSPYMRQTAFSYYSVDGIGGHTGYSYKYDWAAIRKINKGYLSTPDFYPHSPRKWDENHSFYHGIQWIKDARAVELQAGDNTFSPFVCAGWTQNPEKNLRPAQYLALLKILGVMGAEFYYSAYFNNVAPEFVVQNPKNYIWQMAMPSYAQAVFSRSEDLLLEGDVLKVDSNHLLELPSNRIDCYNVARELAIKDKEGHKFLITTSIQPRTNYRTLKEGRNETVQIEKTGNLPGLILPTSYQGCTYILEVEKSKDVVLCALDNWHENTHPERWSRNLFVEAELYDKATNLIKKTVVSEGGNEKGLKPSEFLDFSSFRTFVLPVAELGSVEQTSDLPYNLSYIVQPRFDETITPQQELMLQLRSKSIDEEAQLRIVIKDVEKDEIVFRQSFSNIITDEWSWFSVSLGSLLLSNTSYELTIEFSDDQLNFDSFILAFDKEFEDLSPASLTPAIMSDYDFEISKNCSNEIKLINNLVQPTVNLEVSYILTDSRFQSWKSAKKKKTMYKHPKGKAFYTGREQIAPVDEWNGSLNSPVFSTEGFEADKVFIKQEVFINGKRVGKTKKQVDLIVLHSLELDLNKEELCLGDSLHVEIVNSQPGSTFRWYPSIYEVRKTDSSSVFLPNKSGYLYVQEVQTNGCVAEDSVYVKVRESNLSLEFNDHPKACEGDKAPVEIPVEVSGGTAPYTFSLEYDDNVNSVKMEEDKCVIGNGKNALNDQLIKLKVSDNEGCVIEDYLFIQILEKTKCKDQD